MQMLTDFILIALYAALWSQIKVQLFNSFTLRKINNKKLTVVCCRVLLRYMSLLFLFSAVTREAANCRRISRYQMGTGHPALAGCYLYPLPPATLLLCSILQSQLDASCLYPFEFHSYLPIKLNKPCYYILRSIVSFVFTDMGFL